ncbi:hypothetical protein CBS9595_000755 [Malassezia furfur]|nr:hypothetical protein CBS9595_000755 [Malassezia furfur]
MWADVRRRLPYYASDWTDALRGSSLPIVMASVVQIFFINLMPAIAYVLDMYDRTDGSYGVNEVILASALAAIVFSLFSVQPLTFVGVTGLTNLMNYTVYDIAHNHYGLNRQEYLRLQCWMLIWGAGFHFLAAIFNLCDYTRFVTDMISDTFGLYVGVIYVQKGIELLVREFGPAPLDNATGWLAVTIAVLFSVTVYFATMVGASTYLPFQLRRLVGQLAFVAGCLFWTGFSNFPGHTLKDVAVSRLPITRSFFPTLDRDWVVDFWNAEVQWVFVGAPLGFLLTLLFYFDHNVSSVMAQARKFPITKPAGFHWDFFLLGCTTFVSGILGLPVPNGLVPQAPYHTDSLAVYTQEPITDEEQHGARRVSLTGNASLLYITHFAHVRIARVVEQRLSHFVIGLLTIGAMTRPILVALGTMPRAVFAGVFLVVGWASIESNPIVLRTLSLLQDRSAVPMAKSARPPLMQLRRRTIALFVGIQWLFFGMTIAISQTIAAIGFPVIIILMIPCRVYFVPRLFAPHELETLDAPTATAPAVMCSLGVSQHSAESKREVERSETVNKPPSRTNSTHSSSRASRRTEPEVEKQPSTPLRSVPPASTPPDEPPRPTDTQSRAQAMRHAESVQMISSNTTKSSFIEEFELPVRTGSQRSRVSHVSRLPRVDQDESAEKRAEEDDDMEQRAPKKRKSFTPRRRTPSKSGGEPPASAPSGTSDAMPAMPEAAKPASFPALRGLKKKSSDLVRPTQAKRSRTVRRTDRDDSSDDEPGTEYERHENPPRGPGKGMPGIQSWGKSSTSRA